MKLHRGTPLNNFPNCMFLRRITQRANGMNGSELCAVKWRWAEICTKNFTQEDTSNLKKCDQAFLGQIQPGTVIVVELHQQVYWCTSASFAMGRIKYNKQGSMNSPYKCTAQCIYNGFMSHFVWILILFYISLNVGISLKRTVNLVL